MVLPRAIWVLGFVSLFMDVSSEIIHGLLPVFLVTVLGASYTAVGLVEGIGEGATLLVKILSGPFSDRLRKRKTLVLIGYSLAAFSKPLFAIATSVQMVFGARLSDRIGKGIRGAPRDALIADVADESIRGKAYGLRQSLDTAGAFIGPLLAIALMSLLNENFRLIFWLAMIPALISVALIIFGVHEPDQVSTPSNGFSLKDIRGFSRAFWLVCACGGILQLARLSEAFLILRAKELGLAVGLAPLVLVAMNIVYAISAYPLGGLSDRIGRKKLLIIGTFILAVSHLMIGLGTNLIWAFLGVALWGLHMGFTQGVLAAFVADTCPVEYRGTAFGFFNLFSAIALMIGSPLAGFLWDQYGAGTTFTVAAGITVVGLGALLITGPARTSQAGN